MGLECLDSDLSEGMFNSNQVDANAFIVEAVH